MKHLVMALGAASIGCFSSPSFAETASLTEAEIAPCNELLSYRSVRYKEDTTKSNLEHALSNPPFTPLYPSVHKVKDWLARNGEGIAAIETGNIAAQRRIFGKVYKDGEIIDELSTRRQFQCMLNVRLRQLQSKASKK